MGKGLAGGETSRAARRIERGEDRTDDDKGNPFENGRRGYAELQRDPEGHGADKPAQVHRKEQRKAERKEQA